MVHAIATIDVIFSKLACVELGYVLWRVWSDCSFIAEQKFCTTYLIRKRKRIRKFVNKVRGRFNKNVFQVKDNFGDIDISKRSFEDMYINAIIQEGQELAGAYPEKYERHEIYRCHLQIPKTVTKLTEPSDIFKPIKGQENATYPRTILVIGRPGIGKTMLTKKFLHQWKENKDEFWHEIVLILLQLRKFNEGDVSLGQMIMKSEGIAAEYFDEVFNFILSNQKNTVLIFYGLDELSVDGNLLNNDTLGMIPQNQKCLRF